MKNIIEITSTQNNLVKYAVKLQNPKFRKNEKMIFVDGEKTITGLISDGIEFEYLFLKKDYNYNNIKAKNIVLVNDEIFKKISTTKSPSEMAGIIKEPVVDKNIFFNLKKIALIDGIKDAGNLGTIIRSAAAFSIEGIILLNECVDLYNSKTIRASAQNMFKVPVAVVDIEFVKKLKNSHKLVSCVVDAQEELFDYNFSENFIIAFGSEADGLSNEIIEISDDKLTITMDNNVESINLAICASIVFAAIKFRNKLT